MATSHSIGLTRAGAKAASRPLSYSGRKRLTTQLALLTRISQTSKKGYGSIPVGTVQTSSICPEIPYERVLSLHRTWD